MERTKVERVLTEITCVDIPRMTCALVEGS